ncbi:MAG: ribosome maturation factor RimP [Thermodesulfobacteriota bacterium]
MSTEIKEKAKILIDPILLEQRLELVEIEYRREARGWVLRLYIDKEGGVTLDDCTRVSQEVGRILDVEDLIPVPYFLEVSSPGLTRPLKTERDFRKAQNHLVKIRTFEPVINRREFKGKLLEVTNQTIEIDVDGVRIQIPISKIAKANLELEFK